MSKKPLKNPNGFGSVVYLGDKRRNPYGAMVTVGWYKDAKTGKDKQKRKYISYHPTRKDALIALANYNQNPYDLDTESLTFAEVYDLWSKEYFPKLTNSSSVRTVECAYRYYEPISKMKMIDVRVEHLEGAIKDAKVGDATKGRMKSIANMMYKYALAHEIVDKDYASLCFLTANPIKRGNQKDKKPFSKAEIQLLWDNYKNIPFADMVLIGIYSGWRPQELAILKVKDIDLDNKLMFGGMKTDAGKNRYVPIISFIEPLIRLRVNEAEQLGSEYLFNDLNGQQGYYMTYDKYRKRFQKVMERLKLDGFSPHCTRHTFITLAKQSGFDEYLLKLIVGHAISDITEKTYTHRQLEELKTEMEKIKREGK